MRRKYGNVKWDRSWSPETLWLGGMIYLRFHFNNEGWMWMWTNSRMLLITGLENG